MKIVLIRDTFLPRCTLGKLYIDGTLQCQTLEDTMRQRDGQPVESWKIPRETAIPTGVYPVTMTLSSRFKKVMPLLHGVAGFSGVRVHAGNTHLDTEGCIILGADRSATQLINSRIAVNAFYTKLQFALDRGESVTMEVVNGLA